ncbi:MAG: hypothetical protein ACRC3B_03680 [Bacteroidia bacterium]
MNLIAEIIKSTNINFRNTQLGDTPQRVKEIEGNECEENAYSNPFYRYLFEVGEMEEVIVYYNFDADITAVKEITVYFIHYPDHYWKKAGNTDLNEFYDGINNKSLPDYCNEIFEQTMKEVLTFFQELIPNAPVVSLSDAAFNEPYHNFSSYQWKLDNDHWLSVARYVDDADERNIKNTMKIHYR